MNNYLNILNFDYLNNYINKLKNNTPNFEKTFLDFKNNIQLTTSATNLAFGISNEKILELIKVIIYKLKNENFNIMDWDYIIQYLLNFLVNKEKIEINEYFNYFDYIEIGCQFLEEYFFIIKSIDKEKDIFLDFNKNSVNYRINISLLVNISNLIIKLINKILENENIFSMIYENIFYEKIYNKRFDEIIRSRIKDFDKIISEEDINNIITDDEYNKIISEENIAILKKDLNKYYNLNLYQIKLTNIFKNFYENVNKEKSSYFIIKLIFEYLINSEYENLELFYNDFIEINNKYQKIFHKLIEESKIDMKENYENLKKFILEILLLIDYKENDNNKKIISINLNKYYNIDIIILYNLIEKISNYINKILDETNQIQPKIKEEIKQEESLFKIIENIQIERKYKNLLNSYIYYFDYYILKNSENNNINNVVHYEIIIKIVEYLNELEKDEKIIILMNLFKILEYFKKISVTFIPTIQEPIIQEPIIQEPIIQEPTIQEPIIQEPNKGLLKARELNNFINPKGGKKTKSKKNKNKKKTRKFKM
jgi:hypothetical protein